MSAPIDDKHIAAQALIRQILDALEVHVEPVNPDDDFSQELKRREEGRIKAQLHQTLDAYLTSLPLEELKRLADDPERLRRASQAFVDTLTTDAIGVVDKGVLEFPGPPIRIGGILFKRSIPVSELVKAASAIFVYLAALELTSFKPWSAVTMSAQARERMGLRERPARQNKDTDYDEEPRIEPTTGMEFVWIPPGEFMMGCSPGDSECQGDEKPQHRVRITKGFEMGKYPVTQAHWEAVMGNNPSAFKGAGRPVEKVSWDDTHSFLSRLNDRRDGYRYRLPTEAEWEYAARSGTTGARYGQLDQIAWFGDNSGNSRIDAAQIWWHHNRNYKKRLGGNGNQTHQVGRKAPNAWGLYDTLGNVLEWCQDWYGKDYYASSPREDPRGPGNGEYHVARGGSWYNCTSDLRASYRSWGLPTCRDFSGGFRCVREAISL